MIYKNSFFVFIKRFLWRLYNLSIKDFLLSYFPKTILIPHINFEFYKELYRFRIKPDKTIKNNIHFILIKPEGLPHESEIMKVLNIKGLSVVEQYIIHNYMKLEVSLYNYKDIQHIDCSDKGIKKLKVDDKRLLSPCLWLEADKIRCPDTYDNAKILILYEQNLSKIHSIKRYIRKKIGHIRFCKIKYMSISDTVFSSYIHIPDKENRELEYSILKTFLSGS